MKPNFKGSVRAVGIKYFSNITLQKKKKEKKILFMRREREREKAEK